MCCGVAATGTCERVSCKIADVVGFSSLTRLGHLVGRNKDTLCLFLVGRSLTATRICLHSCGEGTHRTLAESAVFDFDGTI